MPWVLVGAFILLQVFSFVSVGVRGTFGVGSGVPILTPMCQDVSVSPDGNTAYTAHFANLRKWTWNGSVWTNIYTLACAPGAWLTRITVDYSAAVPVIYGMHNIPSKLVKWVDNGPGSTEQTLYTSTGIQRWYGIAFTPSGCEPGTACDDNNPATGTHDSFASSS